MSETTDRLNQDVPASSIEQREGPGGRKLDYVSGYYVVDTLNQLFGPTQWRHEIKRLEVCAQGKDQKGRHYVAYLCEVRLEAAVDHVTTVHEDVGFGEGADHSPGKCHESASKEAVTDALKRAARHMGRICGLSLYRDGAENPHDQDPWGVSGSDPQPPSVAKQSGPERPGSQAQRAMEAAKRAAASQGVDVDRPRQAPPQRPQGGGGGKDYERLDADGVVLFGKHKGTHIEEVPDGYLKFLRDRMTGEDRGPNAEAFYRRIIGILDSDAAELYGEAGE